MNGGPRLPLRCRLGWLPTVEWAGLYESESCGHFAAEGLEVELVPGGPGHRSAALDVAEGLVDIGLPSDFLAVVELVERGAPLRVVGAVMGSSPLGIARPAERGPVTTASLRGCRVGAGAPSDRSVVEAVFTAAGIEPDFSFHLVGPGTAELEAGEVDAICCSTISQPVAANRRGVRLATATFASLGLPMPADVVVVREDTLAERSGAVAGFLKALARGWAAALADAEGAVRLAVTRPDAPPGTSAADAAEEHGAQAPFVRWSLARGLPLLGVDTEELERSLVSLASARGTEPLSCRELVDLRPLTAARASAGARPAGDGG